MLGGVLAKLFCSLHFIDVLLLHWGYDEAGVGGGVVLLLMIKRAEGSDGSRALLFGD